MKTRYLLIAAMINLITFGLGAKPINIEVFYESFDAQGKSLHYAVKGITFQAQDTDTFGDVMQQIQGKYNEKYSYQPGQVKSVDVFDPINKQFITVNQSDFNKNITPSLIDSKDKIRFIADVYLS